jgi:dTDP-4-dehydrorhamnose 3,5-epimerase
VEVLSLAIPDVKLISPKKHGDTRGFFSEVFKLSAMEAAGLPSVWRQDNHSFSPAIGTIRGLHFQRPPFEQAKLVRVTRGAILDVAVDIRPQSPTYARHVAIELSSENWRQLYIPAGFAHGFCTLTADVEVQYKVTNEFSPEHDAGVFWNDPAFGIAWPFQESEALLSEKDKQLPLLKDLREAPTWR